LSSSLSFSSSNNSPPSGTSYHPYNTSSSNRNASPIRSYTPPLNNNNTKRSYTSTNTNTDISLNTTNNTNSLSTNENEEELDFPHSSGFFFLRELMFNSIKNRYSNIRGRGRGENGKRGGRGGLGNGRGGGGRGLGGGGDDDEDDDDFGIALFRELCENEIFGLGGSRRGRSRFGRGRGITVGDAVDVDHMSYEELLRYRYS
jgi:hypothetical protein